MSIDNIYYRDITGVCFIYIRPPFCAVPLTIYTTYNNMPHTRTDEYQEW